jgi:hypothetical protein
MECADSRVRVSIRCSPCPPVYFGLVYFVYLIPGDEGFVSVWVMDAGVIRSFWARDSIWPQNAYLQVDDMRELCRQPVRNDTLHRETSIFQRQRIIYISTPNLTGRVAN